jgi:hypothetical protein
VAFFQQGAGCQEVRLARRKDFSMAGGAGVGGGPGARTAAARDDESASPPATPAAEAP